MTAARTVPPPTGRPAHDSPGSFKRYPSRLRLSRLPGRVVPVAVGPHVYRVQWNGQLCFAVMMAAFFLGSLPTLGELSGIAVVFSIVYLALQLAAAGVLLYHGVRRQVVRWPQLVSVVATAAAYALLPVYWTDLPATLPSGLPPWLAQFLAMGVVFTLMCLGAALVPALLLIAVGSTVAFLGGPGGGQVLQADLTRTVVVASLSLAAAGLTALYLQIAEDADTAYSTAIAQATALKRSRSQSDEQERLDRLIHDNVMAALLDASRAEGRISKRTRELAQRAISVLQFEEKRAAGTATTYVHALMDDLLEALTPWRSRVRFSFLIDDLRPEGHPRAFLPADTAQALIHAVTEAVSNSARHSGADTTFVTLQAGVCAPTRLNPEGFYLAFEVMDHGRGFQMRSVDSHRLGVRVSIIGNAENAGGRVQVLALPHRGTTVRIGWPRDAQLPA